MNSIVLARILGLSAAALTLSAQAALPTVNLAFTAPTGTLGPNDNALVQVTMSVAAGSPAFAFDSSLPNFGLNPADFPQQGFYFENGSQIFADFTSYSGVFINTGLSCTGNTFYGACGTGGPYDFSFHTVSTQGNPSINFLSAFSLQPGNSYDYLFGTFTPTTTPVPPGIYAYQYTSVLLGFQGMDAVGNDLTGYITVGETCSPLVPTCLYTRTVTAVPEPGSYGLMTLGLVGIGCWMRRMRRAA